MALDHYARAYRQRAAEEADAEQTLRLGLKVPRGPDGWSGGILHMFGVLELFIIVLLCLFESLRSSLDLYGEVKHLSAVRSTELQLGS